MYEKQTHNNEQTTKKKEKHRSIKHKNSHITDTSNGGDGIANDRQLFFCYVGIFELNKQTRKHKKNAHFCP